MSDYTQTAKQRWPGHEVKGTGRWAVTQSGVVRLFEELTEARAVGIFRDVRVEDLEPSYVPQNCREIGYE